MICVKWQAECRNMNWKKNGAIKSLWNNSIDRRFHNKFNLFSFYCIAQKEKQKRKALYSHHLFQEFFRLNIFIFFFDRHNKFALSLGTNIKLHHCNPILSYTHTCDITFQWNSLRKLYCLSDNSIGGHNDFVLRIFGNIYLVKINL